MEPSKVYTQSFYNNWADHFVRQANAQRELNEAAAKYGTNSGIYREFEARYESEMAKGIAAVGTSNIAPSIPQDLDPVYRSFDAKNEFWGRNMLLRAVPKIQGYAVQHEYALQTSTGLGGTSGYSTETGVGSLMIPDQNKMVSYPKWIKLLFQQSNASQFVRTLDGAGTAAEVQARANLRRLQNQSLIWGDTRTQKGGVSGLAPKGLIQLIEEGTNGTATNILGQVMPNDGINYNGLGHTWDWKGQGPSKDLIAEPMRKIMSIWGNAGKLACFLPHDTLIAMEALENGNRRGGFVDFAIQSQVITGMYLGGTFMSYIVEQDLSPFSRDSITIGKYTTRRPIGAPTGAPLCTASLQNEGTEVPAQPLYGLWDDNPLGGNGNVVRYVVTYRDGNDLESLGVVSNAVTVTGNGTKEVKLVISGVPAGATRIRIYRMDDQYLTANGASAVATEACWIMDAVPSDDGSAVTVVDYNQRRPYTGTALIMNVQSPVFDFMSRGSMVFDDAVKSGALAEAMSVMTEEQASSWTEGVVRQVHVGPTQFTNYLANVADTFKHFTMGSWASNEIVNPNLCAVIRNIPLVGVSL